MVIGVPALLVIVAVLAGLGIGLPILLRARRGRATRYPMGYPQHPGYPQQPGHPQMWPQQQGYSQPGYPQSAHPQQGCPQHGYPQQGYPPPGHLQPGQYPPHR